MCALDDVMVEEDEEERGGRASCGSFCVSSASVWQAANYSAGKQCHLSSVCHCGKGTDGILSCLEYRSGT